MNIKEAYLAKENQARIRDRLFLCLKKEFIGEIELGKLMGIGSTTIHRFIHNEDVGYKVLPKIEAFVIKMELAHETGISLENISSGKISSAEWTELTHAAARLMDKDNC